MKAKDLLVALDRIAPLDLAEDWDNVGMILEAPGGSEIERILLAIDLNEAVLEEALELKANMILAYHPPIFAGLTRLRMGADREGNLLRAAAAGISLYSPHTALDAVGGGVADWLAESLGNGKSTPLASAENPQAEHSPAREVRLDEPAEISELVSRIKKHLGLETLRLAESARHQGGELIKHVALCPGAGGSLISESPAQLYLTGEMRHHDVLAALSRGTSVLLCEHSNTERGYLPRLQLRMQQELRDSVEVLISSQDREPLRYS
ncbi:MAG: Nif3-like dinuclear metal center hexameric protein [Planctomycetota bacterium]